MTRHDEKRMSPLGRRVGEGARVFRGARLGATGVGLALLVVLGVASLLAPAPWDAVLTAAFVAVLFVIVTGVR